MREPETYRADRRNTCLRPTMGVKQVWNSQFYYHKHTKKEIAYIPGKSKELMQASLRRSLKGQRSNTPSIRLASKR